MDKAHLAEEAFYSLMDQPVVTTEEFHRVLGELHNNKANVRMIIHMEGLLHVNDREELALARKSQIPTYTYLDLDGEGNESEQKQRLFANGRKKQIDDLLHRIDVQRAERGW